MVTRIIIEVDGDNVNVSTEIEGDKVVKQEVEGTQYETVSQYARIFDESCPGWRKDAQWNLMFLLEQQKYANYLLEKQKYLFLNDVYKLLGMAPTKTGQIVGWIYEENNTVGDNYVDFGLYDITKSDSLRIDGFNGAILLDFNVDGEIISRLK